MSLLVRTLFEAFGPSTLREFQRQCAGDTLLFLATLKQDQGRYAANLPLAGKALLLLGIEFGRLDFFADQVFAGDADQFTHCHVRWGTVHENPAR